MPPTEIEGRKYTFADLTLADLYDISNFDKLESMPPWLINFLNDTPAKKKPTPKRKRAVEEEGEVEEAEPCAEHILAKVKIVSNLSNAEVIKEHYEDEKLIKIEYRDNLPRECLVTNKIHTSNQRVNLELSSGSWYLKCLHENCKHHDRVRVETPDIDLTPLQRNIRDFGITHKDAADVFIESIYSKYFKYSQSWYYCNPETGIWLVDSETYHISYYISEVLKSAVVETLLTKEKEENDEKGISKDFKNIREKCYNINFINSIIISLKRHLLHENFETVLDSNPDLIGFKDGKCYDLTIKERRKILPEDHISKRVHWDYRLPSEDEIQQLQTYLYSFWERDDYVTYIKDAIGSSFFAMTQFHEIFQLMGTGGNGKGYLINLTKVCFLATTIKQFHSRLLLMLVTAIRLTHIWRKQAACVLF